MRPQGHHGHTRSRSRSSRYDPALASAAAADPPPTVSIPASMMASSSAAVSSSPSRRSIISFGSGAGGGHGRRSRSRRSLAAILLWLAVFCLILVWLRSDSYDLEESDVDDAREVDMQLYKTDANAEERVETRLVETADSRTNEMLEAAARAVVRPVQTEDHRVPGNVEVEGKQQPPVIEGMSTLSDEPPWVLSGSEKSLPACEKIFLYTMKPWWGFASEYNLYIRAMMAAQKLGYTFLEDDRRWNYGRLSNYFEPRQIDCVPPNDWADTKLAVPLGAADWQSSPRIRYSRLVLGALDDWTREEYLSTPKTRRSMDALRAWTAAGPREERAILPEGRTLPAPLEPLFLELSKVTEEHWSRLRPDILREVERAKRSAGLDVEPNLVDRQKAGDAPTVGARLRRGPIVGVHVRLGDKATEYAHDAEEMGIVNTFGNMTVYAQAVVEAHRRLQASDAPPLSSFSPSLGFSPSSDSSQRPTVLLMTTEPDVLQQLASEPLLRQFSFDKTLPPSKDDSPFDALIADEKRKIEEIVRTAQNQQLKIDKGAEQGAPEVEDDLGLIAGGRQTLPTRTDGADVDESLSGSDALDEILDRRPQDALARAPRPGLKRPKQVIRLKEEHRVPKLKWEPVEVVGTVEELLDEEGIDEVEASTAAEDLSEANSLAENGDDDGDTKRARKRRQQKRGTSSQRRLRKRAIASRPRQRKRNLEGGLAETSYSQSIFNRHPLLERVLHTRALIRDLTLLTRYADAFVVSGSSNIGRLAMLLGGLDAVTGPRNDYGESLGGRIRSIDAHWYPTAYVQALWEHVPDIRDTDDKNMAEVPAEHAAALGEEKQVLAPGRLEKKQRKGT